MFLNDLKNITELKIQKFNITKNYNISIAYINNMSYDKNILNIMSVENFNSLDDKAGNYLLYGTNGKISVSKDTNFFITEIQDEILISEIINKNILNFNNYLFKIYDIISNNNDINLLLKTIKNRYNSNVCFLNSSKNLLYNIFDFSKVNNLFPLRITTKTSSMTYAYLAFEYIDEIFFDEINFIINILNNFLHSNLNKLMKSKDNFYNTVKNLCNNIFTEDDNVNLKSINWDLNDNYKMIFIELDGGLYKYRDMFVHGNKFILDHPMYLYSILENNNLIVLVNETYVNFNKLKEEINEYTNNYKLKYIEVDLKNDLLNFNKAYELAIYMSHNNINVKENLKENLVDLIYDKYKKNTFLDIIIPDELFVLKEHDETKNSELLKTLYYYLIEERSLMKAAKHMDVHRNSIVYRTGKINDLVDIDLENAESRYNILIALEIMDKLNPGLIK